MTRADLEKKLTAAGLARVAKDIAASARESAGFRATDGPVDPAASRLGGMPLLAAGQGWPARDDRPLGFVAQIRLGDLPSFAGRETLPADGWLSFFYDVRDQPWGFDPQDEGGAVVLYRAADQPGTEHAFPDALEAHERFPPRALSFFTKLTLPDGDTPALEPLDLTSAEQDAYYTLTHEEPAEPGDGHQVLGHARPLQNAMELECQLVTHDIHCGDPGGYEDPRAEELRPGAADWTLLLQLDSDEPAGMMWGDLGRLYFWIRGDDLAQRAFERTWTILQCG